MNGFSNFTNVDVIKLHAGTDPVTTTFSAAQVDGIQFTGSDAGASVNVTGSNGDQHIYGTAGSDVIATGAGLDAVNISQGGSDTLVFDGSSNDMDVTGFMAGVLSGGGDVLNFQDLSLTHGVQANIYRTFDYSTGKDANGVSVLKFSTDQAIVGIVGINASTDVDVATVFKGAGDFLNNRLADVSDMVFMVSKSGNTGVNVWKWVDDSSANHQVEATELTLLGTLESVTSSNLISLTKDNFIV